MKLWEVTCQVPLGEQLSRKRRDEDLGIFRCWERRLADACLMFPIVLDSLRDSTRT